MQERLFTALDEIEKASPAFTIDAGASKIMSDIAQTPNGLRLLAERYGRSPSSNIVNTLASILAQMAASASDETAPLVFEFAINLQDNSQPETLISALSAMQLQISMGSSWGKSQRPPGQFSQFLQSCLNFSGTHAAIVQDGAVEVLNVMCQKRLIETAFYKEEIDLIGEKIEKLSKIDNDLLNDSTAYFMKNCRSAQQK